jgi:hypothetical protein
VGEFYIMPYWNLFYFYLVGTLGNSLKIGVTFLPYVCNLQPVHYTSGVRTRLFRVMGKGEVAVSRRIIIKSLYIYSTIQKEGVGSTHRRNLANNFGGGRGAISTMDIRNSGTSILRLVKRICIFFLSLHHPSLEYLSVFTCQS